MVQKKRTIVIFAFVVDSLWDPDTVKSGLPGSEEALVYLSQALANLNYQVTVLVKPPDNSPHSKPNANPRFIEENPKSGENYDIGISWRMPTIATYMRTLAKKVYLWPHETIHEKFTNDQMISFDDVIWLSEWQRKQWIFHNPVFAKYTRVFGNGIDPTQFQPIKERDNPYSCIYGSNYGRGLRILLEIWPKVRKAFPKATLDIYYGWRHWGALSVQQEKDLRNLVLKSSTMDVKDHGLVSHEQLAEAYQIASLWTYPCIANETFCISALKAQLSGTIPVIIQGSALTETVRYGYQCSKPEEYLDLLLHAMSEAESITLAQRQAMGRFILENYTWVHIANRLKQLFEL